MNNDLDFPKTTEQKRTPAATQQAKTAQRSVFDDDEPEGMSGKKKLMLAVALLAAGGGVAFVAMKLNSGGSAGPHKQESAVMVTLPPLPPPPLPKPTPPPQIEQPKKEMVVQEDVKDDEKKPDNEPPPAPAAATSLKGGSGDSGLVSTGTGNPFAGFGKKAGSKFGYYAADVQRRFADALRNNKGTRSAKLDGVPVRIWVDSNARISRVELRGSSGQPAVDEALRQALLGLTLAEPPPADMEMPINLRLNARPGLTAQR